MVWRLWAEKIVLLFDILNKMLHSMILKEENYRRDIKKYQEKSESLGRAPATFVNFLLLFCCHIKYISPNALDRESFSLCHAHWCELSVTMAVPLFFFLFINFTYLKL